MVHELKSWPLYFDAIVSGEKTFESRKDDRGFALGDVLLLREWDPRVSQYTGRTAVAEVSHILSDERFGVQPGFVVMGLRNVREVGK